MQNTSKDDARPSVKKSTQFKIVKSSSEDDKPKFKIQDVLDFIEDWKIEFTTRIENEFKSRKQDFTFYDALKKSSEKKGRSKLDNALIEYLNYIRKNPLNENDYFKYLNSYKEGKKLDLKYFKHDTNLLFQLYAKIDKDSSYNAFNKLNWQASVLFMVLKFKGVYEPKTMDKLFCIKFKKSREFNPITNLSRPLRGMLPPSLKLVQYDIKRAFPTFIDMDLKIERTNDVYSLIDKLKFNALINIHKGTKDANIEAIRKSLGVVYGSRVNEVITDARFNTKGGMYEDLVRYEEIYIKKFIKANNLKIYVRLHDAIFVEADTTIKETVFDKKVVFERKEVGPPEIINTNKLFYSFDGKNQVETSPVSYKDFFEQENFIRVSIQDEDTITIFKDTNNVVKPFNHKTNTVSFLKSKINELETIHIENKIAKDNTREIKDSFCLLDPVPLTYYRDGVDTFGIPFKNGFFKYEKNKTNLLKLEYKEVKGFFPEQPSQKHEFKFLEKSNVSIFERFLTLVSVGKDPLKVELTDTEQKTQFQFFRMFGYLLHTYKDPSFCPSIILSDLGADDNSRNGRRGKSLIGEAIKHVQSVNEKRGNEFDGGYRHRFADLTEADKIYFIDDVPASFNYDDLYTNIVGSISVEPKGSQARTIDFKDTPKFLITTNWAVRYDASASSTNARFMEFKLVDFFNINHTPVSYFEHRFFEGWSVEEWNDFYNFCFACVGAYIEYGVQAPIYDKQADNFRAYFYNDTLLEEFERIFKIVSKDKLQGFNVSEFLKIYQDFQNNLKFEKFFTSRNTKTLIETYLKHTKTSYKYREDLKKWFIL